MGADGNLLQGEVNEDSQAIEKDVEKLLAGFLKALIVEQTQEESAS